ncbi:hypothetical protein [Pseudochryseolinea flava]|uniref:Uncharacterized protein n=1 Tax=Pseudochryseolinea flava TaxID=2059302 RepID=A0A364XUW5_9BACT|nr:hypothetical protein [Pseudochryseolinea flava]RAV98067.1 hypothetical protein DQQ10_25375 [Pseudochryseolinea flava]
MLNRNNRNNRSFLKHLGAFMIIALVTILTPNASAQEWPSEMWHEGKIVLLEGDTLKGAVKYDMQQDLIQFTPSASQTIAYTARKILYFEIFDQTVRRYRQFFALPYTTQSRYRAPVFFELLTEGKLTLLARESIELRTYSSMYYYGSSYSRQVLIYKYYFLTEEGDIEEFTGNKNDLLDMMGKYDEDVEKYIRTNKLRFEDKADFARIVAFYNSLF